MTSIMIAASIRDAVQHDLIGNAGVVTPRSPHGVRGISGVDELRVTAAMIDHPSLPFLLDCARPCFATTRSTS